jgi:hypothetical protein
MSFRSYDLIRLVKEHGQVLTLRKASAGTYDPATGTITGSTNTDTTFKGYPYNYVLDQIDGTIIKSGDLRLVVPPYDTSNVAMSEPESSDLILGLGDTVQVVSVQTVYSAGTIMCYLCQVRE